MRDNTEDLYEIKQWRSYPYRVTSRFLIDRNGSDDTQISLLGPVWMTYEECYWAREGLAYLNDALLKLVRAK